MTPHLNRLGKTILVMGRDMSFKEVIWKIIPKFSLLPILIWRIAVLVSGAGLSHPFLGMGPGPLELGKIARFD